MQLKKYMYMYKCVKNYQVVYVRSKKNLQVLHIHPNVIGQHSVITVSVGELVN